MWRKASRVALPVLAAAAGVWFVDGCSDESTSRDVDLRLHLDSPLGPLLVDGDAAPAGASLYPEVGLREAGEVRVTRGADPPLRLTLPAGYSKLHAPSGEPLAWTVPTNGEIQLIINTPLGRKAQFDERSMRLTGLRFGVPCITTLSAAKAVVSAIRSLRAGEMRVIKLQEIT